MLGRTLIGGKDHPIAEIGKSPSNHGAKPLVFGIGCNEFWPKSLCVEIESVLAKSGLTPVALGSCATSLALSASGELAGYAEAHVGFWDIAAGMALCEAAGLAVRFQGAAGASASSVSVGPASIQPAISSAASAQGQSEKI